MQFLTGLQGYISFQNENKLNYIFRMALALPEDGSVDTKRPYKKLLHGFLWYCPGFFLINKIYNSL